MSSFEINSVALSGGLTRDPELRWTSAGTSVCKLRIANTTRRKDSVGEWVDKPNYFDVSVWRGLGEWIAQNLRKGDRVVVSGRIEWREWDDKDGNNRQSYDVIAESVVSIPKDGSGGESDRTAVTEAPADQSES